MTILSELFNIKNASSEAFTSYEKGDTAFISNGDCENSIIGYVDPIEKDRVFNDKSICLSSFGEATIPPVPFLPRGNGGSGLLVLLPKKQMSDIELYSYASQINLQCWKFDFSRMAIKRRIVNLALQKHKSNIDIKKRIQKLCPKKKQKRNIQESKNIKLVPVVYIPEKQENGLCCLNKKTALPKNQLDKGSVPYVTTSSFNNGVTGFFDLEANFNGKCLTVALNGSVGETFFQFDDFITSGDNAVLTLHQEYNAHLLFYISVLIKNHQWRYTYHRKLNLGKLNKMQIPMPFKNDEIDLEYIEEIVSNSYGFYELKEFL